MRCVFALLACSGVSLLIWPYLLYLTSLSFGVERYLFAAMSLGGLSICSSFYFKAAISLLQTSTDCPYFYSPKSAILSDISFLSEDSLELIRP
jgi:hypothetical protein